MGANQQRLGKCQFKPFQNDEHQFKFTKFCVETLFIQVVSFSEKLK